MIASGFLSLYICGYENVANTVTVSEYSNYRYSSKLLEMITSIKCHSCVSQLFVFGWMAPHADDDVDVSSSAVLTLHKDLFCCTYTQQVGG